jgi:Trk K+ transport system NAD-binding subunit
VVGVDRGGQGFIPEESSTFQEGDVAHVVIHRDAVDALDELLTPLAEG